MTVSNFIKSTVFRLPILKTYESMKYNCSSSGSYKPYEIHTKPHMSVRKKNATETKNATKMAENKIA